MTQSEWLKAEKIYFAVGEVVSPDHLRGIQRFGAFWRLYVDNINDRVTLLAKGINLRNKNITLYPENPRYVKKHPIPTTRITVNNVPLSADDGQIRRALEEMGCDVINLYREKLRINYRLTNCDTGARIVIAKRLTEDLPRLVTVGRYTASIWYYGQPRPLRELQGMGNSSDDDSDGEKKSDSEDEGENKLDGKEQTPEVDVNADEQEAESAEEGDADSNGDGSNVEGENEEKSDAGQDDGVQTDKKGSKKGNKKGSKKKDSSSLATLDKFLMSAKESAVKCDTPNVNRERSASKQRTPPLLRNQTIRKKSKGRIK